MRAFRRLVLYCCSLQYSAGSHFIYCDSFESLRQNESVALNWMAVQTDRSAERALEMLVFCVCFISKICDDLQKHRYNRWTDFAYFFHVIHQLLLIGFMGHLWATEKYFDQKFSHLILRLTFSNCDKYIDGKFALHGVSVLFSWLVWVGIYYNCKMLFLVTVLGF